MLSDTPSNSLSHQVTVVTSARLHMGFYDLSFHEDHQRFGSVGLCLQAPQLSLEVGLGATFETSPELVGLVQQFCMEFDIAIPVYARLLQAIPRHAGLGSGTQIALALSAGLNQLFNFGYAHIAQLFNRGGRSGIGIGAFATGGFLVDGGKQKNQNFAVPDIIERVDFPSNWRIILVGDDRLVGVHGATEKLAFSNLPQIKNNLQELVFKGLFPALKRQDLLEFGAYMADLQAYNGDYFAPIQGGRFASQDVAEVLGWLQNNGVACVGQSSWGPTGFAILENQQQADNLQAQAQLVFADKPNISFKVVQGKNTGANLSGLGASGLRA